MNLGTVVGQVVSTRKDDRLVGSKLLIVRPDPEDQAAGTGTYVAVDTVGAGVGETVLVCRGFAAARSLGRADAPVDAVVVGIVDVIDRYDVGETGGERR